MKADIYVRRAWHSWVHRSQLRVRPPAQRLVGLRAVFVFAFACHAAARRLETIVIQVPSHMYLFFGLVDLDNIEKKLISLPSSSTGAERKEEDAPEEEAKDGHRSDLIIRRRCCMDDKASAFQNASPWDGLLYRLL